MAVIFSKKVTPFPGLHLKSRDKNRDAVLIMDDVNTAPTTSGTSYGALYMDGGTLYFAYNGSATALGTGSGGVPSFETLTSYDQNMSLSSSTFSILQSGAYAALTLNKSNVGAGAVIDITNAGTGADIIGTSDTWQVSAAGAAEFQDSVTSPAIVSYGAGANANLTIDAKGTGTITLGATSTGAITLTRAVTATASITVTGTAASDCFTVTAGDCVVSDGSLSLTDADNAESVTVINNAATDIGNASSSAVFQVESTSLTSGCLMNLQLTEGTLSGGSYFRCWDATAGAAVFTVAENGDLAVAGTAGSNALAITAGDVSLSDGSVTIADADNAASLSVTNNTATTASVVVVAGSGTFTGSTTSSFMTLTPSGLTSGTGLYFPLAAMTTGKGLHMVANALTSGTMVSLTSSGTVVDAGKVLEIVADSATTPGESAGEGIVAVSGDALTTGCLLDLTSTSGALTSGHLADFSHIASSATLANKSGGLVNVAGNRTTTRTSGTTADDYDVVSVVRTSVMNGAGGALTAAGSVLYVQNVATQTAGTLTDTVNGIEVVMDADGTGAAIFINQDGEGLALNIDTQATTGNVIDVQCDTITTGKVIDMSDLDAITEGKAIHIDATGVTQTSGVLVHIDSASTAITGAGRLFFSAHTGNAGVSAVLNEFASAATDETTVLRVTASAALAGGVLLDLSAAALTTGTLLDMTGLAAITTGKAVHIDASGVTQTDGILVHVDSASTALSSTGRLLLVDHTGNASVSGVVAEFASAAADETQIVQITASAALAAGKCLDISAAAMTTGCALDIGDLDALTTGKAIDVVSNSADVSGRDLIHVKNDNSAAVGTIPLHLENDALVSTNFKVMIELDGLTLYTSDGTSPNGALSGSAGDVCLGADSGKAYYCTGTTNWTAL